LTYSGGEQPVTCFGKSPTSARLDPTAGSVVHDVARGATESPVQVVGGVRDAAQSTLDFFEEMLRIGREHLPEPNGIACTWPGALLASHFALPGDHTDLPEIREARTVTGGANQGITGFVRAW
jgi:hypothetical protein